MKNYAIKHFTSNIRYTGWLLVGMGSLLIGCAGVQAQELKLSPAPALSQAVLSDFDMAQVPDTLSPYDYQQLESLYSAGLERQQRGEHRTALDILNQAFQVARINYGLYHDSQIPLLESIVVSEMELQQWQSVDERYDYMELLYHRLYDSSDPRLEAGLQKISSFHVNAYNVNLNGDREFHLRKAARVFKMRLELAQVNLEAGHPLLDYLHQSLEISRQQLYFFSERRKQELRQEQRAVRNRMLADLE